MLPTEALLAFKGASQVNKLSCCVAVAVAGLGGVAEEYVPGTGWQAIRWLTQDLPGVDYFINLEPFTFTVSLGRSGQRSIHESGWGNS